MSDWWEHIEQRGPGECWPWLRSLDSKGYPQVRIGEKLCRVHRLVIGAVGPVHHKCGNRRCLNPAHLEEKASTYEHMQEHLHAHCIRGHLMIEMPNGRRRCRECHVVRNVKSQRKRRRERRVGVV